MKKNKASEPKQQIELNADLRSSVALEIIARDTDGNFVSASHFLESLSASFPICYLGGSGRFEIVAASFSETASDQFLNLCPSKMREARSKYHQDDPDADPESLMEGGVFGFDEQLKAKLPFRTGFIGLIPYSSNFDDTSQGMKVFRINQSVVFDNEQKQIVLCGSSASSDTWRMSRGDIMKSLQPRQGSEKGAAPISLRPETSEREYLWNAEKAIDEIYEGRYYQINLLRYFSVETPPSRVDILRRMEAVAGPQSSFFDFPSFSVASFSPERFFSFRRIPSNGESKEFREDYSIEGGSGVNRINGKCDPSLAPPEGDASDTASHGIRNDDGSQLSKCSKTLVLADKKNRKIEGSLSKSTRPIKKECYDSGGQWFRILANPIKGTIGRSECPKQDSRNQEVLRTSTKDQAELNMIIDLMRNDLNSICQDGTVQVTHAGRLSSFSKVHHLMGQIQGVLAPDLTLREILRAMTPGGSITGAPKIEVMKAIEQFERRSRGFFMGNAFYLGDDGGFDSSILIRTMVRIGSEAWKYAAGSGIVVKSEAMAEKNEIQTKCRVVTDLITEE